MKTNQDISTVREALAQISSDSNPSELAKTFGLRFNKAWNLLEQRKIKLYIFKPSFRTRWIVEGSKREYLILPNGGYCGCDDFYFSVIDGKALSCQHLLAQKLAWVLGDYIVQTVKDGQFSSWMNYWRNLETTYSKELETIHAHHAAVIDRS